MMERDKKINIERLNILEERETKIVARQKESRAIQLDAKRRYLNSNSECEASVLVTVKHRILVEKQERDRFDFVKHSQQFQGSKVLTSHAILPQN